MSLPMRILLIAGALLAQVYILFSIRKTKMKAENALFWVLLSAVLVLLGIFSPVATWIAGLLGAQSPANLVYLVIIALLLFKVFSLSVKLSALEKRLQNLVQVLAIAEKDRTDEKEGL